MYKQKMVYTRTEKRKKNQRRGGCFLDMSVNETLNKIIIPKQNEEGNDWTQ